MKAKLKKAVENMESCGIEINLLNISYSNAINPAGWLNLLEPGDFVDSYWIDIEVFVDDELSEKKVIGSAICHYISGHYAAYDDLPVNFIEVADEKSADLRIAVEPVIDHDGGLKDDFIGLGDGFLYIDKFYIEPDYRGKGIGTVCFSAIKDVIGREAGVITAIPAPREDDGTTPIEDTDPRYSEKLNRLQKFLAQMGFYNIKDTVWANNTALRV